MPRSREATTRRSPKPKRRGRSRRLIESGEPHAIMFVTMALSIFVDFERVQNESRTSENKPLDRIRGWFGRTEVVAVP